MTATQKKALRALTEEWKTAVAGAQAMTGGCGMSAPTADDLAARSAAIWQVASIRMQQAVGLVCAQHQRAWLAETAAFRAQARKRGWVLAHGGGR